MSEAMELAETGRAKSNAEFIETIAVVQNLPDGWRYQNHRIADRTLTYYASPVVQLLLVAVICLLLPGSYNALTGLGGGGQADSKVFDLAQETLYSTFAVSAFFSGSIVNRMGVRWTLVIGGLGYTVFVAAQLCYKHAQDAASETFVVVSGGLLGVTAGLLWAAQGVIMVSYPPEHLKGRFISWFWCLFNLGAVIGSLVSKLAASRSSLED